MKRRLIAAILLLSGQAAAAWADAGPSGAVADPSRLEAHRARDADRKPADILALSGVKAGDKVADLAAGGGYYTGLLSRLVGPDGRVYAVDPERIFEAFPDARETFPAYLEDDPLKNVDYTVQKFDALTFPEPLDAVFMVLYYHDTLWTGADRAAMNRAIFDALKPGGVYLIIDHNSAPDADASVTRELHRMVPGVVMPEVTAAGFALAGESDILKNAEDPLTDSVFSDGRRGKTDRFVYLFRKP